MHSWRIKYVALFEWHIFIAMAAAYNPGMCLLALPVIVKAREK